MRRPLSLAYLSVEGADPVAHIEAAAAAGFDCASPRIFAPTHAPLAAPVLGEAARIRDIRRACARTGVKLLDAEVLTLGPSFNEDFVARAVALAAALEFSFVQVVSEESNPHRAEAQFGFLCRQAATANIRVALEFMRFRACAALQDAANLVAVAGEGVAGMLIDPLHLARSGGHPDDLKRIPREHIAMLQLCDAPAASPPVSELAHEARHARLAPGEGELPLRALLAAVPGDLPISVELPNAAARNRPVIVRAKAAFDAARDFLESSPAS